MHKLEFRKSKVNCFATNIMEQLTVNILVVVLSKFLPRNRHSWQCVMDLKKKLENPNVEKLREIVVCDSSQKPVFSPKNIEKILELNFVIQLLKVYDVMLIRIKCCFL